MKPLIKAILFGSVTILAYLLVVVVTTPALEPASAISAAIQLNSPVIFGMGLGVGLQLFLSDQAKKFGCSITKRRSVGGNSGTAAFTSFFSFFSLVPLGCCGWWLYAISFLPSVFGVGVSAGLINYSQPLSYVGLGIIFGYDLLIFYKIKQKKAQMKQLKT